jgi:predicted MPP superfamily phosphohydrolase
MASEPDAGSGRVSLSDIPALLVVRGAALMLLVVSLVGALHAWLAHRLVSGAGLDGAPGLLGWALFALLFLSIPTGFYAGRRAPSPLTRAVLWSSHLWIGLFGILLTVVAALELARLCVGLFAGPHSWSPRWAQAGWVLGLGLGAWGYLVARGRARVRRLTLAVKDLGEGLRGVRVAQVSDIHIGQTLGRAFLQRMVAQVNALEPDIIAVTGDLVDGFVDTIGDQVAPLGDLRARLGVFYVPGNHEFNYGGAAWMAEVARLGLTVLQNTHRVVERDGARLAVAGVSDHDGAHFGERHACRPDLALKDIPSEVPRVLLAHQPRSARLVGNRRVDLQLSGHTHGGQIFPFKYFVRLQQPVIAGLHAVAGVRVYTHSGTGYWGPPMRVGAAPEIALLTLVPE